MQQSELNRREWLAGTVATAATAAAVSAADAAPAPVAAPPPAAAVPPPAFRFMLNTATVRGQELLLPDLVDLVAKTGYQAIEPWMGDIDQYLRKGHLLSDLRKRIADSGLTVESAIGFAEWIVDDQTRRDAGLETAKRDLDRLAQLGARRLAAPPAGATRDAVRDLSAIAGRFAALVDLSQSFGITPQVEVWGFSQTLSRLGEAALVALESGRSNACVLADVYHLHRGGSGFATLKLLSGSALQVFHMNDYPADPPREKLTDAHRVYPGDGVAPLKAILTDMKSAGFRGWLSLELFNREYWKQDAATVLRTGLDKMKSLVASVGV